MNDRILHTKRGMNDWILSALHDSNVILDTVQSVHGKCGCCILYCIQYAYRVQNACLKRVPAVSRLFERMGAKLYATAMTKYFLKLSFTAFRLSCISKQSKGGEGAPGPPSPLPPPFHSPLPCSSPFFPP